MSFSFFLFFFFPNNRRKIISRILLRKFNVSLNGKKWVILIWPLLDEKECRLDNVGITDTWSCANNRTRMFWLEITD